MAKREKVSKQSLSVEDTNYLKKNTSYSEEDIKTWFKNFKKDCPNGILDKKKVNEIYTENINPNRDSTFLVDQLFRIIDDDNNGGIDFKEFMIAVDMSVNGSKDEQLRWMFRFYDEDDSGSIEFEEMSKVLSNIYQCEGLTQREAMAKAKDLFDMLDADGSGEIDKEEFIQGLLKDIRRLSEQSDKEGNDLPKVKIEHID